MAAPGAGRFRERFVVGWFDRSEWREVCKHLYSDEINKQMHAVGRIAVWKSRMMSQLPLAVECTCSIIQAVIEDKSAIENSTINEKDLPLRMNYSTALVRFVSLLTEKLQTKTLAQPMHELAETLGMPFWMVELRHNASHGTMPSLQMLRSGAQTALDWLKKEYWDVERMAKVVVYDTESQEERERNVEDTLVQYLQERYTALSLDDSMIGSAETKSRYSRDTGLTKLTRLHKRDSKTLVKCLLKDGYLVPEEDQLRALDVDIECYLESGTLGLPLSLVEMWSELLPELKHSMSLLLVTAMSEARRAQPLRSKLLYSWVALVLESVGGRMGGNAECLGLLYFITAPLIDYHALLDIVVKSPNERNRQLLPRILSGIRPRIRRQQRNHILQLTDLLLVRKESTRSKTKKKRLKSVQGLSALRRNIEEALEKMDNPKHSASTTGTTKEPDAVPDSNCWRLADESVNWGEVPFGLCPGEEVTSRNLELGQCVARDSGLGDKEDGSSETNSSVTMETDDDVDDDESERRNGEWSQDVLDQIRGEIEPLL